MRAWLLEITWRAARSMSAKLLAMFASSAGSACMGTMNENRQPIRKTPKKSRLKEQAGLIRSLILNLLFQAVIRNIN